MEELLVEGKRFAGVSVDTEASTLLMIKAKKGFLGCGYFSIETANKLGEHVAIVTGVGSFNDMLTAEVVRVSRQAKLLGIHPGMSGKEALLKLS